MAGKRQQVAEYQRRDPILCATAGCPYEARVRVRRRRIERVAGKPNPVAIPHGPWLNFCFPCDDRRHRDEAEESCVLMGLDTPAKQRAWCIAQLRRKADMLRPEKELREPGQDADEFLDVASQA